MIWYSRVYKANYKWIIVMYAIYEIISTMKTFLQDF